jgi:hypothetical protein
VADRIVAWIPGRGAACCARSLTWHQRCVDFLSKLAKAKNSWRDAYLPVGRPTLCEKPHFAEVGRFGEQLGNRFLQHRMEGARRYLSERD